MDEKLPAVCDCGTNCLDLGRAGGCRYALGDDEREHCTGGKPEAWVVGMLRQDGTVATVSGAKRYPNESFARAAAEDRQREKPFMSFTAVRV